MQLIEFKKMISKSFAILLFSVIAICHCQYFYHHTGYEINWAIRFFILNQIFYGKFKTCSSWRVISIFRIEHHSKTNMVWFKVDEPEGCKEAPEEVSDEELPKDICEDVGWYKIRFIDLCRL